MKYFNMKECYLIQRFAKISGKCMVYLYSQIDTNMLPLLQWVIDKVFQNV